MTVEWHLALDCARSNCFGDLWADGERELARRHIVVVATMGRVNVRHLLIAVTIYPVP
jgi:hypothetical protein